MRLSTSLGLAVAVMGTSVPVLASDLVDPATGTRFESETTVDGTDFRCLGAGVPHSRGYAVAYCVEAGQAETIDGLVKLVDPGRSGARLERTLTGDQRFFDALAEVPGDKLVVIHLVAATSQRTLSDSFRAALAGRLSKAKLDKLEALVASGGARGDTALIYSHGAQVTVDIGGVGRTIEDAEIASKVWDTWLGPQSISPSLKSSIAHCAAAPGMPTSA